MLRNQLNVEVFKTHHRAFLVLFKHLFKKGKIHIGEAYQILSGVRKNPNSKEKLRKSEIKRLLYYWHRLNLITIHYGHIRLSFNPLLFFFVDEKTIYRLAKESAGFWLQNAPHQLGEEGV